MGVLALGEETMSQENESLQNSDLILFPDKPHTGELKFGYRVTVDWLKQILVNSPKPFRLGITGALGAGKSTLIRNALDELEANEALNIVTAYVDVWKLDKESARRSAILQIAKGFKLDPADIKLLERDIYGVNTEANGEPLLKGLVDDSKIKSKAVWLTITFALVMWFLIYTIVDNLALAKENPPESLKVFLSLVSGAVIACYSVISNLLINTFVSLKNTVSRAPLVGPEEFESCLRIILEEEKIAKKQAIIIFDNIDRAPPERTQEILTGLSAFFDDSHKASKRNLVIVVPFARDSDSNFTDVTIQKFFDAIIPLPEIIPQDLTEYTENLISKSIWAGHKKEISELITLGPYKTPREIIHILNELFSLLELAKQMEGKRDLLSKGLITNNLLAYVKIIVCQDIWESYLQHGVTNFLSVEEMFSAKFYFKDTFEERSDYPKIKKLISYLNATEGLPKDLPHSPEPFYYLKGADELIKIPGGSELEKGLILRDIEIVQKYIGDKSVENNLANLKTVFSITAKKFKHHTQRKKNITLAMLNSLKSAEVFDLDAFGLIIKEISTTSDLISELSIEQIKYLAPVKNGVLHNRDFWGQVDNEYQAKELNNKDKLKSEDWIVDYLSEVLEQPDGVSRAQITNKNFNYARLVNEKITQAMGEEFPKSYSSVEAASEAITHAIQAKFLFSGSAQREVTEVIIHYGLLSANQNVAATLVGFLNQTWNFIGNNADKADFSNESLLGVSSMLRALPNDARCPQQNWQNFLNNVNSRYDAFQRLSGNSKLGVVLFFTVVNKKIPVQNFGNLFGVLQNTVGSLMVKDFEALVKENQWIWFTDLWTVVSQQFLARLGNDQEILKFCLKNCDEESGKIIKTQWPTFKNNPAFESIFDDDNINSGIPLSEWLSIVASNPSQFSGSIRKKCLEKIAIAVEEINFDALVEFEKNDLQNLDSAIFLNQWLKNKSPDKLKTLVDSLDNYLRMSSPVSWSMKDICYLMIMLKNFDSLSSNDACEQLVDKAIQRGIKDGASNDVSQGAATIVVQFLDQGKGLGLIDQATELIEKSSKIGDARKSELNNQLDAVREKYDIKKKGIISKIFS